MALTPEDVVNKRFQPTKFREGYDQDEVDDFLDEVVVELRRLGQENEELRQRLIASESRINELQRSGGQPAQFGGYQPPQIPAPVERAAVEAAPVVAEPAVVPAPVVAPPVDDSYDSNSTNNLLQLARRLHEEHVRDGIQKKEALIADGQATAERLVSESQANADRILSEAQEIAERTASESKATAERVVSEGQATADRIVGDAETKQREQISALEKERSSLEQRIEDLRTFEREYRQKLKGHIEGLLQDLESSSAVSGTSAAAVGASTGYQDFGGR
ncbi:MAG TPA: DivIVA domain-containing protein [Microbacteriaceae bacterium]